MHIRCSLMNTGMNDDAIGRSVAGAPYLTSWLAARTMRCMTSRSRASPSPLTNVLTLSRRMTFRSRTSCKQLSQTYIKGWSQRRPTVGITDYANDCDPGSVCPRGIRECRRRSSSIRRSVPTVQQTRRYEQWAARLSLLPLSETQPTHQGPRSVF